MSAIPKLALALLAVLTPAALAASISGTVTDGTTHRPAAGDTVVLVSLQQRMMETAHTTTDARGRYTLQVPAPEAASMHLVRVDHQKAAYFQPAPPNTTTVDVTVFDVAAQVPGISTEADVFRLETDPGTPQTLHVIQSFFVKNDSHPPRTQFSNHSYDIYLPPDAQIEGAAAQGPNGMPVASSPAPMGEKGHYAYLFPLRPGETQFQISYRLPYSGKLTFAPKLAPFGADNLVVMLPKSMTFQPAPGLNFQPVNDGIDAQTFVAKNIAAAQPVSFAVSGSGALPRDTQAAQPGAQPGAQAQQPGQPGSEAAQDTRPGGGLGSPIDTPDPLSKYKWWILSGIGLALAIGAAFFLRRPVPQASPAATPDPWPADSPANSPAAIPPAPNGRNPLLAALKDELFALEADRLTGKLSEPDYESQKAALETVLRRALARDPIP